MGKVFTSKFVGAGPSSYKERIYQAAVSQRLRNTGIDDEHIQDSSQKFWKEKEFWDIWA